MSRDGESFDQWVDAARIPRRLRSPEHLAVLQAAFAFLQHAGNDYASQRISPSQDFFGGGEYYPGLFMN